jgi:hypothetical protein
MPAAQAHFPPHPFGVPHGLPVHWSVQQPASAPPRQISPVPQAVQIPPHPFDWPQTFPVQLGTQQPPSA